MGNKNTKDVEEVIIRCQGECVGGIAILDSHGKIDKDKFLDSSVKLNYYNEKWREFGCDASRQPYASKFYKEFNNLLKDLKDSKK